MWPWRAASASRRGNSTGSSSGSAATPAATRQRHVRILYAAQTGVAPPSFVLFTNVATEFHFSYERFLINRLRETFGLRGRDQGNSPSASAAAGSGSARRRTDTDA